MNYTKNTLFNREKLFLSLIILIVYQGLLSKKMEGISQPVLLRQNLKIELPKNFLFENTL